MDATRTRSLDVMLGVTWPLIFAEHTGHAATLMPSATLTILSVFFLFSQFNRAHTATAIDGWMKMPSAHKHERE